MKKKTLVSLLVAVTIASAMTGCGTVKKETVDVDKTYEIEKTESMEPTASPIEKDTDKKDVVQRDTSKYVDIIFADKNSKSETEVESIKDEIKDDNKKSETADNKKPMKSETPKQTEKPKKDDKQTETPKNDVTKKDEPKNESNKNNQKVENKKVEKDSDIVEKRDEILYATANLNVRKGPGTNYNIVGALDYAEATHRIGICRNGWSQIDYNGNKYYVSSAYLSATEPVKQVVNNSQNETAKYEFYDGGVPKLDGRVGDIGRLIIPEVGYSAAIFDGLIESTSDNYPQDLVDAEDSMCMFDYNAHGWNGLTSYLGDHAGQEFDRMKNSVPGQTIAYIYWTDGSYTAYQCMEKHYDSKSTSNGIFDENNVNIDESGYDIAMVTCNNESGSSVTVTYWNEIIR